jgi:hypothetical protein
MHYCYCHAIYNTSEVIQAPPSAPFYFTIVISDPENP